MVRERPLKLRNNPLPTAEQGYTGLGILAGTAFASWFLQFFTGLFETWPALGMGVAAGEALLGAAVVVLALREPRLGRRALHLAAGAAVAASALWVLQTKASYSGTMLAHPRYTAPHVRAPYGSGARVVRLTCADGIGVDGMYLGGQQTAGLILYPGWISGKDGIAIASLARWLAPGFQVLVLDPRGSGGSGGFQRGAGDGKADLVAAAAFLRDKGATRIGVLAEGDGSLAATLAAAEDPGIHALLLASPVAAWADPRPGDTWWDDPRSSFGRMYWRVAAGARLAKATGPALTEVLPKVAPRPLLIVTHGGDEVRSAQKLFMSASEPRGMRLLPGAGRPLDWSSYPAFYGAARDWFRLVLEPGQDDGKAAVQALVGEGGQAISAGPAAAAASGSAPTAELKPTPTPEEAELKQILSEPQPLVPALPGPPPGALEAQAASAAAQVPVLPKAPAPVLPKAPVPAPPAVR